MSAEKVFIGGRRVECACQRWVDVSNPATGELITTVPDAPAEAVDRAVAAARASFEKQDLARHGSVASASDSLGYRRAAREASRRAGAARSRCENGKTLREAAGADVGSGHRLLPLLRRLGAQDLRRDDSGGWRLS